MRICLYSIHLFQVLYYINFILFENNLKYFFLAAAQILGKEQLVAMYLTSGTVASFGSHLHKIMIRSATPSLGAVRIQQNTFL